jgi:hypothetical protein
LRDFNAGHHLWDSVDEERIWVIEALISRFNLVILNTCEPTHISLNRGTDYTNMVKGALFPSMALLNRGAKKQTTVAIYRRIPDSAEQRATKEVEYVVEVLFHGSHNK